MKTYEILSSIPKGTKTILQLGTSLTYSFQETLMSILAPLKMRLQDAEIFRVNSLLDLDWYTYSIRQRLQRLPKLVVLHIDNEEVLNKMNEMFDIEVMTYTMRLKNILQDSQKYVKHPHVIVACTNIPNDILIPESIEENVQVIVQFERDECTVQLRE
jgi:hypothetical protein